MSVLDYLFIFIDYWSLCKNQMTYVMRVGISSFLLLFFVRLICLMKTIFCFSHQVVNKLFLHVRRPFLLSVLQDCVKSGWSGLILVFNVLGRIVLSCSILDFFQEVDFYLVAALQTEINFILRILLFLGDGDKKIVSAFDAEVEVSWRVRILGRSERLVFLIYFTDKLEDFGFYLSV